MFSGFGSEVMVLEIVILFPLLLFLLSLFSLHSLPLLELPPKEGSFMFFLITGSDMFLIWPKRSTPDPPNDLEIKLYLLMSGFSLGLLS